MSLRQTKIVILLSLLLAALAGCGNNSGNEHEQQLPGSWRYPSSPGADGVQYGELIEIPGGTFTMGWLSGDPAPYDSADYPARPTSSVTVSGFFMDKFEVTNAAYRAFLNTTIPNQATRDSSYLKPIDLIQGAGQMLARAWFPVDSQASYELMGVSWYCAISFANWRSALEGLNPVYSDSVSNRIHYITWDRSKNGYRLATEAEWEYAARGNTGRAYPWGPASSLFFDTVRTLARCSFNAQDIQYPPLQFQQTALARRILYGVIGRFNPNQTYPQFGTGASPFGVLDMAGSAGEWVWDAYGDYTASSKTDPIGPDSTRANPNRARCVRGGNTIEAGTFSNMAKAFYTYTRSAASPDHKGPAGIRLVRNR